MGSFSSKKNQLSSNNGSLEGFSSFLENPIFLKTLLDCSGDQLIIFDAKGQLVYVNDTAVKAFGYSRSYLLKKNIVNFMKEKTSLAKWRRQYFDKAKRGGHSIFYRIERVVKGGGVQLLDVTSVYVPCDESGVLLSIGRDVTRQVQLQRALHDSKNLYRFLTEGAKDGIAALDTSGRFVYANAAFQKMMGFDQGEYRGMKFFQFICPQDVKKAKNIFQLARNGEQSFNEIIDAQTVSGSVIPFEINVTPLIKAGKVVSIHVIARDLRPRQQMDLMARQSEKMDAIRYFVSGTAQELKNPLMGVAKRADGLLKKYLDRDFEYVSYHEFQDILSNIEKIRDQAQYCYETSQRLMAFGQKKAGIHHGLCNPNSVIKDIVKDKKVYMHQHEIRSRLLLVATNLKIEMSVVDLTQVLHNLFDNAIQAMPSGGVLTVKTKLDQRNKNFIIEIKDQGVGIPKDQLPHVFEPFFTTKSRGIKKNSGLGLPIVYSLVKDSKGDLEFTSSLRCGTVVKIVLPVYRKKRKKSS